MAIRFHVPEPATGQGINLEKLQLQTDHVLRLTNAPDASAAVVFIDDTAMAEYNLRYRNRQGPTNVLSFPSEPLPADIPAHLSEQNLGDILIAVDTAKREADANKITLHDRLLQLIIHGLLHLQGWDHERSEQEAQKMWDREQQLYTLAQTKRRSRMPHLAINVDHVATIRQARGGNEPDPVTAAAICELAGAAGIVVHLREDRRHIQDRDVLLLRQTVKTKLNLEMAAAKEIIDFALKLQPDMVTLVPEKRKELTTEGGLDVVANEKKMRKTIKKMADAGIPVSIFIDPDATQIEASQEVGATFVELHTGRYCDAKNEQEREEEFQLIKSSAELAFDSGLRVNAGHGLDYQTTSRVASLSSIEELSIGHAIMSRAIFVGLDQAVREMLALIRQ